MRIGGDRQITRIARGDLHCRAHGIARQFGRERAIQHIHALNFRRTHHAPARRIETGTQQVADQQAIDIHQRPRALRSGIAATSDQRIAITDIARANRQVRCVAQQILAADHITLFQAFAINRDAGAFMLHPMQALLATLDFLGTHFNGIQNLRFFFGFIFV